MIITIIIPYHYPAYISAIDVIGEYGSIPGGGSPGVGGGLYSLTPSFRVGIISEEFRKPLTKDENSPFEEQIKQHYVNHFPKMEHSIIFSPPETYVKDDKMIGWYEPSSHDFKTVKSLPDMHKKHRKLLTNQGNKRSTSLFGQALINIVSDDPNKQLSALGNEAWLEAYKSISSTNFSYQESESQKVWNYILSGWKGNGLDIESAILNYAGSSNPLISFPTNQQLKDQIGYIDLLMTLYALSPDKQKDHYAEEIDRFIDQRDMDTRPPLIAIDTVVSVTVPAYSDDILFVPSVDYIMYIAGVTKDYVFTNPAAPTFRDNDTQTYKPVSHELHSHTVMANLVYKSMQQLPRWKRITSLTGTASTDNGFSWGQSGVSGYRLKTNTGNAEWHTSSVVGVMESLKFSNSHYGFIIAKPGDIFNLDGMPPVGKFSIIANDPEVTILVPQGAEQIGKPIILTLNAEADKELDDWALALSKIPDDDSTYPNIKIDLALSINGTPTSFDSKYPIDTTYNLNTEQHISKQNLMNFIEAKEDITINHNISSYPIVPGEYTFRYDAKISIKLDENEPIIELEGDPASASKTFINEEPPPEPIIEKYTSEAVAYAEIKEGSPGQETFDAMAGTPTTQDLYFAAGGSEFIVEFEAKYLEDQVAERTYRSYFTETPCQYKEGDTAPSQMLGDQMVDLHHGGTYSKTWTGSIPNNATAVTALHNATCTAKPDWTAYNAAKSEADAFANKIRSTTLSFTSSSDKKPRSHSSWSVQVNPTKNPPQNTSASVACKKKPAKYDKDGNVTSPAVPCQNEMATANPSGPGNYRITVTWTVPPHCICGPCCTHTLPLVEDRWKQTITYDTFKITKAKVWKLDRSYVDGMRKLLPTDEVTAQIIQGDPNIFCNIASAETSQAGRIRYSLEPKQCDNVVWDEGPRTNTCDGQGNNGVSHGNGRGSDYSEGIIYTNKTYTEVENHHQHHADTLDKKTLEFKTFDEHRLSNNIATIISDFLILQTSSGDQSILYYEKPSTVKHAQQPFFDKVIIPKEDMWENNTESAYYLNPDSINIGSYNGAFYSPESKYKGTGNKHQTITILDNDPAEKITRPTRPTDCRLMVKHLDVTDTIENQEYITGDAKVFYRNILNEQSTECTSTPIYSNKYDGDFNSSGIVKNASYSPTHAKINDIVIHNPVSAEYAMVVSNDDALDQRTPSTQAIGGNLQSDTEEYVTRLKDVHPKQNFIVNGDAEQVSNTSHLINWKGESSDMTDVHFTRRVDERYTINGTGSFEINVPSNSNRIAKYVTTTIGKPNTSYDFSGKISAHRCFGYFTVEALNENGDLLKTWKSTEHSSPTVTTKAIHFTTPADTVRLQVSIVNGNSNNSVSAYADYVFADDLSLTITGGEHASFVPLSYTITQETTVPNPHYVPEQNHNGDRKIYSYTGNYTAYSAPVTGRYILETWGAQGGNGSGGRGGYSYGKIDLTEGDMLYIYPGGDNGWNGGGSGHGRSNQCGGGASDIRYKNNSLSARIIVAGGGGGYGGRGSGGIGGGSVGGTGGDSFGSPGYGGSQNNGGSGGNNGGSSGSFGQGGSNHYGSASGGGGGGGGWYGGGAGGNDYSRHNDNDDSGGGGGSGYIGSLIGGYMKSGNQTMPMPSNPNHNQVGHSGDGYVVITEPDIYIPEQGPKTITTTTEITKSITEPPDSWYETVTMTIPANPNVSLPNGSTILSSDLLTLDYPFQVYFPNKGDFYGNGAHGLSQTTKHRGKGYKDEMDTTEWTAKKVAKFNYNVIYEGTLYPSGYEILLEPIDQEWYNFYLPLANKEAISADTTFYTIANNGKILDHDKTTNKLRYGNKESGHSAVKKYNIDIVGRIGNFIMEDTGDFRFSNLFKKPLFPHEWFIPNAVYKVDTHQQHKILGPTKDIRNYTVSPTTNHLNTYGSLDFLNQEPIDFPLIPSINNITSLQRQPLRFGYPLLMDIQTIGNYYGNMQIINYYYHLNLQTGDITPVDVYMKVDTEYEPINIFDAAVPGWDPNMVYDYKAKLDWDSEAKRRNYQTEEQTITEYVQEKTYNVDALGNEVPIAIPLGQYHTYGNGQIMYPNERNRTFIGTSETYGEDKNPGNTIPEYNYNQQAQRWHFTFKLPSSAIFTPHGQPMTKANIESVMNNTSVIVAAADIKAVGDTYVLQYEHPTGNGSVTIAGTTHSLASIPYSVYAIYSAEKSAANDLSISGTH